MMKYYELDKEKAEVLFNSIFEGSTSINDEYFSQLDSEYLKMRNEMISWLEIYPVTKTYDFDLFFAIKLYEYFNNKNFEDFNEAVASNYGFWRYICLKVVPDIIIKRHGLIKEYFYSKNVRLYIPTLWWYIEMCYQKNLEQTYECLKDKNTDYILQIVERPGRSGMFLEVSRLIVYYLSCLPEDIVSKKYDGQSLLRRIVIQNTAKNNNYNLSIEGKEKDYVISLFESCGIEVNKYDIK